MLPASTLITRIGPALYGELWKKALAKRLTVDERNIYRWIEGRFTPRPGVFVDLLALMKTRRGELDDLIEATEAYLAQNEN
jgi:hypothetical protein